MHRLLLLALLAAATADHPARNLVPGAQVRLHAHNCYEEDGRWADRMDRALATRSLPLAIEQDIAWAPGVRGGSSLLSHRAVTTGREPSLEEHFFARMTPVIEAALKDNRRERWPLYVLHLDFKTNEPEHHRFVWNLLGRYEHWLTTAPRVADERRRQPLRPGPLLVLTENGEGQAATFHDEVPVGGTLRLFGTLPSALTLPDDRRAQLDAVFRAPPRALIPGPATNYRRWTNFSWAVIEHGGQKAAGAWTRADEARLRAVTRRAQAMHLWLRFYTLNGHREPAMDAGWTESYNFGSPEAVLPRWRAAIRAGVDFVATDQYEAFAEALARR